jgi:hypothetical protein
MKIKLPVFLIPFVFSFQFSLAQAYQWAVGEGGGNEDRAFGIASDRAGNVFVTGQIRSTAFFDTISLTSAGVEDVFLAKYDSSGLLQWAKRYGGTSIDIGYDVVADDSGNCYVAGVFYGTAQFESFMLQSSGTGDAEIFIMKVNSAGALQWVKTAGSTGYDLARGLAISQNRLYVTGVFSSTASFDTISVTSTGLQDVFLAAYDLSGNVQWAIHGGGAGYDVGYGAAADSSGNAYVTGYFQGQAVFGNDTVINSSNVYIDMFVFKADSTGNVQWVRRGGATGDDDAGRSIAADSAGNVYVAGEVRASGNFDSIPYANAGIAQIFVAKYNSAGSIQYLSTAGGAGGDYAYGIAANAGNVFITGLFNGIAQFGAVTLSSAGINDIYLARLDAATGTFLQAIRAGGTGDDAGRAVDIYTGTTVVQAGDFEHSPSTFIPFALTTNGAHDIFTARIDFSIITAVTRLTSAHTIAVYPNPSNRLVYFSLPQAGNHTVIEIYSSTGSCIEKVQAGTGITAVDVSHLPSGIYFYQIKSNGKPAVTEKLVKE